MKHTPGPWEVLNQTDVFTKSGAKNAHGEIAASNDGWMICTTMYGITLNVSGDETELPITEKFANARRIVDCVNACEGIADPTAVPELLKALERLAYGCKSLMEFGEFDNDGSFADAVNEAMAAIAKAKGEA